MGFNRPRVNTLGGWRARALLLAALVLAASHGNSPAVDGYSAISTRTGWDKCEAATVAQMQTWWTNSSYYNAGIYIGGSNRSCANTNLTSTWITAVHSQGWGLYPTWVGPQAPDSCNPKAYSTYISTNATTARTQGIQEATAACNAAQALGMDLTTVPLIYDIESYSGGTTCRNAVKAFIDGWSDYLFKEPGETFGVNAKPGVYGSECGSYIDDFAFIANPPSFIWFAYWNGNMSVTNTYGCLGATHWTSYQRHKQYTGNVNETHGGITFKIDNDCSWGPVYDNASVWGGPCG
jgi:hypothetical protein